MCVCVWTVTMATTTTTTACIFSKQSLFARAHFHIPFVRSHSAVLVDVCVCVFFISLPLFCHIIKHKVKPIEKCIRTSCIFTGFDFYFYFVQHIPKRARDSDLLLLLCFFDIAERFPILMCLCVWWNPHHSESKMVEWYQSDVKRQNAIKKREKRNEWTKTKRETNYISYPIFTRSQAYEIHVTSAKTKE